MSLPRKSAVPSWLRLDNAAKIYPAARTKGWMPMFRVSLTFLEDIDQTLMQQALSRTLRRLPLFAYRLRRGLFWHYFEHQQAAPIISPDARNPMLPLNLTGEGDFMFRLRVHRSRVALEVFHALTDGTGATTFLVTLAADYLFLKTGQRIPAEGLVIDTQEAPRPGEWEDAFLKHARGKPGGRSEQSAWQLSRAGANLRYLRVITGVMPTERLLAVARSHGTTVNTLLASIFLLALIKKKEASKRGRNKPVKLSLPVNLRKFYPTATLRNFSFYINVPAREGWGLDNLEALLPYVQHYMALEGMEPRLNTRFSANVRAERNKALRLAPLFLKSLVLKMMYRATGERYMTSTLTNLGQVALPPAMASQVARMDLLLGPARRVPLSAAVISACGRTCLSFSKTTPDREVERLVFTTLIELGVPVTVESNWPHDLAGKE